MILSPASLAFAPQFGTPKKPFDYRSFQGWGRAFLAYHGLPSANLVTIDNRANDAAMRTATLDALRERPSTPGGLPVVVAWFCHGLSRRIQLGWRVPDVDRLADALAIYGGRDVRVVLYCCLTAKSRQGFSRALCDALARHGAPDCQVYGHTTAGRADANPYVIRETQWAGDWVVEPKSALWGKWVKALRGDLKWEMPFLTQREIEGRLA